ncbi:regulator of telomere elongation helicase 1 like protein [Quercus suber]|uniref:Regulator of telomere elongation helicase 1 homolog n=1 Tax=Quercus suber TaxID=58331 RepID=A0AAW0KET5_QUESU
MSMESKNQFYNKVKPFLAVISVQVGYAGLSIISKFALNKGMSPHVFIVYRYAIATVVIAPLAIVLDRNRRPKLTYSVFAKIVLLALLGIVICQNFLYTGMKYTTAAFSRAIDNVIPAFAFSMAWILGIEKVNIRSWRGQAKVLGTIVTVGGAMLMTLVKGPMLNLPWTNGNDHQESTSAANKHDVIKGALMMLAGSVSWSGLVILQAITLKSYPAELSLTVLICLMGTLESTMVALAMEWGNLMAWSIHLDIKLFAIVYAGIVTSAFPIYIQGLVMKDKGPVFVTAFSPLSTVLVAIIGSFILMRQCKKVGPTLGILGKASRTLSWWCFNPGIALEEFHKLDVGSIILTSGTLSPMDSFAQELKLEFPVRLENPHVITPSQIWAGVVSAGPSCCSFNSSYRNRDSVEYKQELGNAIVNFARIVPDGLLVFFSSYYIMDQCIGCWKNMVESHANSTTIWERICKHKKPVIEPRQSSMFSLSIEDYMAKLKDTSASGAIFFAVCYGKVSEGLDFADQAGRAVVITGMPFATMNDPKVLTGEDWYNQQASRAVNQAVGRIIRHRHDYGAIILCDERFAHPYRQSQISLWIQPHIKCYSKFGDVVFALTWFFRDAGARGSTHLRHCLKYVTLKEAIVQLQANWEKFFLLIAHLSPFKSQSLILKCQSDLISNEKKILMPGRKNMQCQDHEITDMTGYSILNEKPSKEKIREPCSARKRKLLNIENAAMQQIEVSHDQSFGAKKFETTGPLGINSVNLENLQNSDGISTQNTQVGSSVLHKDQGTSQEKQAQFFRQKNKGVQSNPVPSGNEESRGSAFLIQVKEKLSAEEYKKFVEFMKALKSKVMKISQVLQSIVRLFSGPERLHLLESISALTLAIVIVNRFKDYLPAKYHSLYEQYLETNNDKL